MLYHLLFLFLIGCHTLAQILTDRCGFPILDDVDICAGGADVSPGAPVDSLSCSFLVVSRGNGVPDTIGEQTSGYLTAIDLAKAPVGPAGILPRDDLSLQLNGGVLRGVLLQPVGKKVYLVYRGDFTDSARLLFSTRPERTSGYKLLKLQAGYQCINGSPEPVLLPPSGSGWSVHGSGIGNGTLKIIGLNSPARNARGYYNIDHLQIKFL